MKNWNLLRFSLLLFVSFRRAKFRERVQAGNKKVKLREQSSKAKNMVIELALVYSGVNLQLFPWDNSGFSPTQLKAECGPCTICPDVLLFYHENARDSKRSLSLMKFTAATLSPCCST